MTAALFLDLLEQIAVVTVLAYVFSKTPVFSLLALGTARPRSTRSWLAMYAFFSAVAVLGTYLGIEVQDAIVNSRAIGPVLAGLLGGPPLGLAVGATGGLHRYFLGGFTDLACGISTVAEGLVAGWAAVWARRHRSSEAGFRPGLALVVAFIAEGIQMLIILAVARPVDEAWALVRVIALPMMCMNSVGAWLFAGVLMDQRAIRDQYGAQYAQLALKIAERSLAILETGLNRDSARELARTLRTHLPVGAVAVTDRRELLAFEGLGEDHHRSGDPIHSVLDAASAEARDVSFLDGVNLTYQCPSSSACPLHSALIVPLRVEEEVMGTIALFEAKSQRFRSVHRSFGIGMARLLSEQLLISRIAEQRKLLMAQELKLVQAQIRPHFLFNALNAIRSVTRLNPDKGRELITHLADFMRANLGRSAGDLSLAEEMEHVASYLEIEKARFGNRLDVCVDIPEPLRALRLPTFTLQPLVENAVKHGIRDLLEPGRIEIAARREGETLVVYVEDNGGSYDPQVPSNHGNGMGLSLVNRRIQLSCGPDYGAQVSCQPGSSTRVTVRLPARG